MWNWNLYFRKWWSVTTPRTGEIRRNLIGGYFCIFSYGSIATTPAKKYILKNSALHIFSLLLLFCSLSAKQLQNDILYWDSDKKLSFDDFQGIPDSDDNIQATSYCRINSQYYPKGSIYNDSIWECVITAEFDKSLSWIKVRNNLLLEHEQLHFDIYELYARKVRKFLSESDSRGKTVNYINQQVDSMDNINTYMQHLFDYETTFGKDSVAQSKWRKVISDSLRYYQKYINKSIVVELSK